MKIAVGIALVLLAGIFFIELERLLEHRAEVAQVNAEKLAKSQAELADQQAQYAAYKADQAMRAKAEEENEKIYAHHNAFQYILDEWDVQHHIRVDEISIIGTNMATNLWAQYLTARFEAEKDLQSNIDLNTPLPPTPYRDTEIKLGLITNDPSTE